MANKTNFAVKPGAVVPPVKRPSPPRKPRLYPLDLMAVDQTIFVPDKNPEKFTTYVHKQGRMLGRKFRTQGTVMCQDRKTLMWDTCPADAHNARRGVAVTRVA